MSREAVHGSPRHDASSGHDIVALSRDLVSWAGGRTPDGLLAPLGMAKVEKVVLIVLDGLGMRQLGFAIEEGSVPNLQRMIERGGMLEMTSTLPSTTVTALVSLSRCVYPEDHGFLGFRLFIEEIGRLVDMIRMTIVGTNKPATSVGVDPHAWISARPLLWEARQRGVDAVALTPEQFRESPFTSIVCEGGRVFGYPDLPGMFESLSAICASSERCLVLAYWDVLDVMCHRYGSRSKDFLLALSKFDEALGEWLRSFRTSRTLLLLMSDHGHIDCPLERTINLREHGELLKHLAWPPSGDARLTYLRARSGHLQDVLEYLEGHLSDVADWRLSKEAVSACMFGPSGSSKWAHRLGDVILFPKENYCFTFPFPGDRNHVSRHGGPSPEEMLIPLLWCQL